MARYIIINKKVRLAAIIALSVCLLLGTIGGVWGYLSAKTQPVDNTFVPGYVACEVEETFQNGVKRNVHIRNSGNVDAYVRAVVVVTFVSDDGKVLATAPVEGLDYTVTWATTGWQKGSDGFWYYDYPLSPGAITTDLIQTASPISVPEGYRLNLQIAATAVQSDPERAVTDAWGITPTNGRLIPQ